MKNVLVIGGGSWGSCLAKLLVENGSNVYLWEHNEKNREIMKTERKNPIFSFEFKLPDELKIVDNYCEVLSDEEKVTFCAYLDRLVEHWDTINRDEKGETSCQKK